MKSMTDKIQGFLDDEKFWLKAFKEVGNPNFLTRAKRYKYKAEALKSFAANHLPGFSLKQIYGFQKRADDLKIQQLNLFEMKLERII